MRDLLETPRTRRARIANLLIGRTVRTAQLAASIDAQVTAGSLSAVTSTTFGLFSNTAADDSCSITSGAAILTSPNNPWTAADVGKAIDVAGAGAAGGTLRSRIKSYSGAGSVTLWDNASTTVAASKTSAGGLAAWGFDLNATTTTPIHANEAATVELAQVAESIVAAGASASRTESARAADIANVKDFGALGDGVTDDLVAFNNALAFCEANGKSLFIPDGTYSISAALNAAAAVSIIGQSRSSTILKPSFAVAGFLFNLSAGTGAQPMCVRDFTIEGTSQVYTGNEKGISFDPAYLAVVSNLYLRKLAVGIWMNDSWGSSVEHIRMQYVGESLTVGEFNGGRIAHFYVQRFNTHAIMVDRGLSPKLEDIICEYGTAGSTAIVMRDTQNLHLDGLYTEGNSEDATNCDVSLNVKNSRRNQNVLLENLWLNSTAGKLINAAYHSGLTVRNVAMQTPSAACLITNSDSQSSVVTVANVIQVDQNANDFLGDMRGVGQVMIPVSDKNHLVRLISGSSNVGDGTDADLSNVACHTVRDSLNVRPLLIGRAEVSHAALVGGLTCTASTTYAMSTGINVYSDSYGSVALYVVGTASSSVAAVPVFNLKAYNATEAIDGTVKASASVAASGNPYSTLLYVPVKPGLNSIQLAIMRVQGGGGTDTFTCTDFAVVR